MTSTLLKVARREKFSEKDDEHEREDGERIGE